jgi:hypothetical protein
MAFSLYSLLKAALLIANALAVLHPHRLLAKRERGRGWGGGACRMSTQHWNSTV